MKTKTSKTGSDAAAPFAPRAVDRSIRVPKTAEIVADQIRRRIIAGELSEGDTLPPETQLMEQFSISRPTLREAFRILETEQLISVIRGSRSGAQVHMPHVENAARYASYVLQATGVTVADIYEARLAIEPYVVRKLAEKRDKDAIRRLRKEADRLADFYETDREIDFISGVAEFHRVLVELGGNQTLHFLTSMLLDLKKQYQVRHVANRPEEADNRKTSRLGIKSFNKLIELIEAGDADGAVKHWELHITNANKTWSLDKTLRSVLAG
jgi:DNA-binding FadR family transcriptional regulator